MAKKSIVTLPDDEGAQRLVLPKAGRVPAAQTYPRPGPPGHCLGRQRQPCGHAAYYYADRRATAQALCRGGPGNALRQRPRPGSRRKFGGDHDDFEDRGFLLDSQPKTGGLRGQAIACDVDGRRMRAMTGTDPAR
jgi:hypothetical protein